MTLSCAGLATLTFPADALVNPPIRKQVTRVDGQTYSGARVEDQGILATASGLMGLVITLQWDIMAAAFFDSLRIYYEYAEANAGVLDLIIFDPAFFARVPNEKYYVKFVDFSWPEDHFVSDYLMQPSMQLVIRGIVP